MIERHDDTIMTEAQIRQHFGWSIREFRDARFYNFPKADYRAVGALGRLTPVWPRSLVLCWRDKLRALIVR